MSLLTVLPPAGSSAEYGVDRCVRCTALNQSARCMGLLLYYNILGEAQALRQTVQIAQDTERSDVTAAAYALAEDASSSLFRKLDTSRNADFLMVRLESGAGAEVRAAGPRGRAAV